MNISIGTKRVLDQDFNKVVSEYRTEIMGLSMISIMLFHQYFTSSIPFNIFHNFGYWGVDVFLFLSGMGLVQSLENNTIPVYYVRRFKRIIPCCILCGTIKYFIFILLGSSVAILANGLKMGWWSLASLDLWFIPAIIIFYAISPILYRLLNKWPVISLTCVFIFMLINSLTLRPLIGYNWNSPSGVFSYTIERLPVFAAGMFASMRKNWINDKIPLSFPFLLTAIGLLLLDKSGVSILGHQAYVYIALTLGMPALIITNICFLNNLPNIVKKCLHFFGSYSLELYLVHEFIFWSIKINFIDVSPWLLLPTCIVLSCLAAYLCKIIIKKIMS